MTENRSETQYTAQQIQLYLVSELWEFEKVLTYNF